MSQEGVYHLLSAAFQKKHEKLQEKQEATVNTNSKKRKWNMKRITKASPAALAIAGAPAIGLGIVATGGVLPVVDAAICVLLTAKIVKDSIKRKG